MLCPDCALKMVNEIAGKALYEPFDDEAAHILYDIYQAWKEGGDDKS